jgi:hypothetical protein
MNPLKEKLAVAWNSSEVNWLKFQHDTTKFNSWIGNAWILIDFYPRADLWDVLEAREAEGLPYPPGEHVNSISWQYSKAVNVQVYQQVADFVYWQMQTLYTNKQIVRLALFWFVVFTKLKLGLENSLLKSWEECKTTRREILTPNGFSIR